MKVITKDKNGVVIKVQSNNGTETRTDQSYKQQTDINYIMRKFRAVGIGMNNLPIQNKGVYGDFTKVKDYQSALNSVINAQKSFDKLPSNIRKRFSNDPAQLLEFLEDPKNIKEGIELGIYAQPSLPNTPEPKPEDPKK